MSENWGAQASFKFGPNQSGLLNVRGENVDDLLQSVTHLSNQLQEFHALNDLQDVLSGPSVAEAVQNFQNAGMTRQGPSQGAGGYNQSNAQTPTCAHGPMKDLAHKNYKSRWYCAAPYGTPKEQQCPPR